MRWIVTFQEESTLQGKVLVMNGLRRQTVLDEVRNMYGYAMGKVYSEAEFATLFPSKVNCKNHYVPLGTKCKITVDNKLYIYPKKFTEPSDNEYDNAEKRIGLEPCK